MFPHKINPGWVHILKSLIFGAKIFISQPISSRFFLKCGKKFTDSKNTKFFHNFPIILWILWISSSKTQNSNFSTQNKSWYQSFLAKISSKIFIFYPISSGFFLKVALKLTDSKNTKCSKLFPKIPWIWGQNKKLESPHTK